MTGGITDFIKRIKIPDLTKKLRFMNIDFNTDIVAVEIGNDWLKIVRKSRSIGGNIIYQISLSKLAQIKGSVSSAIADIFENLKFGRQRVVLYIPRHLVTVRMMNLPTTDPKEIGDMINLQAVKHTPYSKEEIVSSYKIIEADPSGYTKVMLAIAARNIINERMDTLIKAGINVGTVAISSEGVCGWFSGYIKDMKLEGSQGVVLVDIDSNYTDFIVIRAGKMVFTRNIFIGSNHLMQDAPGWRDKFVEELKRSFERYQSEEKSVKIVKVFLTGSGANIKDLDVILAANLEVPTDKIDQLKNIQTKWPSVGNLRGEEFEFVSLTQLLGAAMNGKEPHIDLITSEHKVQGMMELKRKQLTVMGILTVSIVTMLSFLLITNIYNKSAYLAKLKSMASKIDAEADSVEKMRTVVGMVEKRLDSRGSSIEAVSEVYRITPAEIHLTDIDIDEAKGIMLKGGGFAMSDVFRYVKKLEESNMFENVKTTYTTTKKDKGAEFAEFEISCMYQK